MPTAHPTHEPQDATLLQHQMRIQPLVRKQVHGLWRCDFEQRKRAAKAAMQKMPRPKTKEIRIGSPKKQSQETMPTVWSAVGFKSDSRKSI
jgi:hypothetical protein